MTGRIPCEVPFCRRTCRAGDGMEIAGLGFQPYTRWVCGPHWTAVPKSLRSLATKAKRRAGRFGNPRDLKLCHWLWDRCRKRAIEAAGGIA